MKKLLVFLMPFLINTGINAQDHSEFITDTFNSPQEVTQTCLMCHDEAAQQIMKTNHWTWLNEEFTTEKNETVRIGKQNIINNFCIAVPSNYPRCTSCHAGYGWNDAEFDFSSEENVDCLVCHDNSGTYKKIPTGAGMPDESVDLLLVAQSVGKTSRNNCGVCHFDGGGGTGVKHGDLDDSLYDPEPETDYHMGALGFVCTDCHTTNEHKIMGASHGSMAANQNHIYCTDCHAEEVHQSANLNKHVKSIACETCHIPEFAKVIPTKTWWDWSLAGEERPESKDEYGMETYSKIKGEFVWAKNVKPTYLWYNGQANYYRFGDKIDPSKPVLLNELTGSIKDPNSKIAPFKVMRGKQIYDTKNSYLIVPKLFGDGGYWKTFDWNLASENGMKEIDLVYSGEYGFVETEMFWPINHMVVSKDNALKCTNCHGRSADRMDWEALGYEGDAMVKKGRKL
jgi:octaheme c-type cytochrome (tetrathionate reductase family)